LKEERPSLDKGVVIFGNIEEEEAKIEGEKGGLPKEKSCLRLHMHGKKGFSKNTKPHPLYGKKV